MFRRKKSHVATPCEKARAIVAEAAKKRFDARVDETVSKVSDALAAIGGEELIPLLRPSDKSAWEVQLCNAILTVEKTHNYVHYIGVEEVSKEGELSALTENGSWQHIKELADLGGLL